VCPREPDRYLTRAGASQSRVLREDDKSISLDLIPGARPRWSASVYAGGHPDADVAGVLAFRERQVAGTASLVIERGELTLSTIALIPCGSSCKCVGPG
jgi:hypothetical protein